jgi:hypothetical protein
LSTYFDKGRAHLLQRAPAAIADDDSVDSKLMLMVRLVSMDPEQAKTEERNSAPSRVPPSVLRRAVSAADWIAADLRDEGDVEAARHYERVAAELRAHAHARGIRC